MKTSLTLDEVVGMSLDQIEAWNAARVAAKQLRIEHPWVLDLTKEMASFRGSARRRIVIDLVINARRRRGHNLPPKEARWT